MDEILDSYHRYRLAKLGSDADIPRPSIEQVSKLKKTFEILLKHHQQILEGLKMDEVNISKVQSDKVFLKFDTMYV